jgi:hypothetical protein
MNWIIRNTSKLKYHTNLNVLLKPIEEHLKNFKWLVSDLEINTSKMDELPINHDKDWFIINSFDMEQLRQSDTQIIWGVFSAIKTDNEIEIEIDEMCLPYADGNGLIWENANLQFPNSEIEIIAWDSSYTIIKFTNEEMSKKFSAYFNEAIQLEKYGFRR